eukprot:scaffold307_cov162-Amphora_coffeaeformis.AAC.16
MNTNTSSRRFPSVRMVLACTIFLASGINFLISLNLTRRELASTTEVSAYEIVESLVDTRNQTPILNQTKPQLFLHVGPTKTASTTIQMELLFHSPTQKALLIDGINVSPTKFNYRHVNQLREKCLNHGSLEQCQRKWLGDFYKDFNPDLQYPITIKSCETYSKLPNNTFTADVIRKLGEEWDVTVLMVHRRFSSWLPSRFQQYRKQRMRLHDRWTGWGLTDRVEDQLTLGEYLEKVLYADYFRGDSGCK